MLTKEYEGRNREDAVKIALEDLGKTIDEVEIEYLDEQKAGFFGFRGGKLAKIRVSYSEQESPICAKAREFLNGVFQRMNVDAKIVSLEEESDCVFLRIASTDPGLIIGHHGNHLESLQFLTNVVANRKRGDWVRIVLDSEGYRDKREETLRRIAERVAAAARRTKRSHILEPLNPAERRVIHLTLQGRDDVATESEGVGIFKRVRVDPIGEYAPTEKLPPLEFDDSPPPRQFDRRERHERGGRDSDRGPRGRGQGNRGPDRRPHPGGGQRGGQGQGIRLHDNYGLEAYQEAPLTVGGADESLFESNGNDLLSDSGPRRPPPPRPRGGGPGGGRRR